MVIKYLHHIMPQITHYKLIIKSTKLKATNAELIRKILGRKNKEENSDSFIYVFY